MNTKQFKEFMEMMSGKSSPKENNHFDDFEHAVEANNWNENCRLQIASGYLKEAVANWYKKKTESEDEVERNKSFYYLLVEQFTPLKKQHHWQIELNSLIQQEHKRVDTYTTKFKRLLNYINTNNYLLNTYIVRMFLGGLKGMNAVLVTIVAPKRLSKAIATVRRVEHNAEVMKKVKIESELSDLKKRIDKIALNYATLMGKIKNIKEHSQNNYYYVHKKKFEIEYQNRYCTKMDLEHINDYEINFEDLPNYI
ncbi:35594_t:CDS:2 [Gigaspora margarita]|uniref:35594_t:CDS:1 n=1 Tax=Gigaspora margarita TaxID=4874 RepID=A0ABN7W3T7_GIGMA|nr:35594_t:CDS:2 [Gigaspora margarita]